MEVSYLLLLVILSISSITNGEDSDQAIDVQFTMNAKGLTGSLLPQTYQLHLDPFAGDGSFSGVVIINTTVMVDSHFIVLHADQKLTINNYKIMVVSTNLNQRTMDSETVDLHRRRNNDLLIFDTKDDLLKQGETIVLRINYTGTIGVDSSNGIFRQKCPYAQFENNTKFIASYFNNNLARSILPCFDQSDMKALFSVWIAKPMNINAIFSTARLSTAQKESNEIVWDEFEITPPISPSALTFFIGNFSCAGSSSADGFHLKICGRPQHMLLIEDITKKVIMMVKQIQDYFGQDLPANKLDVVVLPDLQIRYPTGSFGLVFLGETDINQRGLWLITQEIIYQWLGCFITPHVDPSNPIFSKESVDVSNALIKFLTAHISMLMNDDEDLNNYPITQLYSLYYEFSKRYPHGKTTVMKQDLTSTKIELIFRMLNYTLGQAVFRDGLRALINKQKYSTYTADDIWYALDKENKKIPVRENMPSIRDIIGPWLIQDRLPALDVHRHYDTGIIEVAQRLYLRERPHDVPDKDRFQWYIPIVLIRGDNINFTNLIPMHWLRLQLTQLTVGVMDEFIIVNPEEIAPFPVNYDRTNWNLISQFLCSKKREMIPAITRAKLLHDAWNLALAGDLNFSIALNMTLFLQYERNHIAWDPVFSFIGHISKAIENQQVHEKFLIYVRLLLTPLYLDLTSIYKPPIVETKWRKHLRQTVKAFLCDVGYKMCIQEAQNHYREWMEDVDNPNLVPTQHMCPTFKWGSNEEWQFGLDRVLHFPSDKKESERTYLLKTLAGCPIDPKKIMKLLRVAFLERNPKLSNKDLYLILSMVTTHSVGYTTLFTFVNNNFAALKNSLFSDISLWTGLITSATSFFKTQEGYNLVHQFFEDKKTELATTDFVVEKALKNIQEEAKWSTANVPVIETWLNNFLENNKVYSPEM